jgi:type I restriction enzyme S subunit
VRVPIDVIVRNAYALNYNEYLVDETLSRSYEAGVVVKTLSDLCIFLPKSKRNAKYGLKTGRYPFFKSSMSVKSFVDEADYNEASIIIGDGGEPNVNYGVHFSTSDHCYVLQNKNKDSDSDELKYVYYYFYHNLSLMENLYTGVAIKNISKTSIEGLKIPLPSLERQKAIVEYLDFIYEEANKSSTEKIAQLKKLNAYAVHNQQKYGDNEIKTLGEICAIQNGKRIVKSQVETGVYPVLGGGGVTSFYTDTYTREGKTCKISREGMSLHNCVMRLQENYYLNSQGFTIVSNDKNVIDSYLWYYVEHNKEAVYQCGRGSAQKAIDIIEFKSIKIPIPSLERQNELVRYCEANDKLIAKLKQNIISNIAEATVVINSIVV